MEYVIVIGLGFVALIARFLAEFAREMAMMRRIAAQRRQCGMAGRIDEAHDFFKDLKFRIIRSGMDEAEIYKFHHGCLTIETLLSDLEETIRVLTHEKQEAEHS